MNSHRETDEIKRVEMIFSVPSMRRGTVAVLYKIKMMIMQVVAPKVLLVGKEGVN